MSREKEFQVGVKSVARDLGWKAFDVHRSEAADARMALSSAQPTGPTEVRRFFKRHSRRWCSALLAAVHPFFHLFVELGTANAAIVGSSPARWAGEQVEAVLSVELEFNAVELWVRWATTVDPPLPPAAIDDVVALKKYLTQWQAPEWLLFPFHPDLLGESRNVVRSGIKGTSRENLGDFIAELTQYFRTELRRGLDDIEKIERVESLRKPAVIIQAVQDGGVSAKLDGKPNASRKMPTQKQTDLSRYLDGVRLTERQRECCALKWEYGWKTTEIEKHLGICRKTISGHISAARQKIDIARLKEKGRAQAARTNPGRLNRNQ